MECLSLLVVHPANIDIGIFEAFALASVLTANVLAHIGTAFAAASDKRGVQSMNAFA